MTPKAIFFADLSARIHEHQAEVADVFQRLDDATLVWQPDPKEWSILICFDHLNQTYAYYQPKITDALAAPMGAAGNSTIYHPSFWGNIYMYFALNPRWSFPTPDALQPSASPERTCLDTYLTKQQEMLDLFKMLDQVDLSRTRIPIEKFVHFNLGDCLKILVYHDQLHIRQARNVLTRYRAQAQVR